MTASRRRPTSVEPKVRVRPDDAARVLDDQIAGVPAGRLIESEANLAAWAEEIRSWLGQTSVELDRVLAPRQLSQDFATMPELGRRPGEPLHEAVDRVQALLGRRLSTLRNLRTGVDSYRPTLRAWLRSLSARSITEQVIAALIVAGIAATLGILFVANGSGAPASPMPSELPSAGSTSSPATPSASPDPVATSGPTATSPSPPPSPVAGATTYATDFSDWSGTSDWTVIDGHAFSAGSATYEMGRRPTFAPLAALPAGDLDVAARIRVVRYNDIGANVVFGMVARASDRGSDAFGVCHNCAGGSIVALSIASFDAPLAKQSFDPQNDWHSYTLRVRGSRLIGLVDGHQVFDVVETANAGATGMGLWTSGIAIEVESFTVGPAN